MRRLALALVVLAAVAGLPASSFAFDDVFQQTYVLPAGGSVQVSGWNRNEVEVYAVKSSERNPEDLERVSIKVEATVDSVSVQTLYPDDASVEVYVDYHIRVPQRVLLNRVATVNGPVRVFGVEAAGELRSVNGDVEVYDSAGPLSAHTTNGNLRLELRGFDTRSPISLETMNGSVLLGLPAGAGAELDVRSLNGEFRSELPLSVQSSNGSREFHARLGSGGAPLKIRTVNGAVRLFALRPAV